MLHLTRCQSSAAADSGGCEGSDTAGWFAPSPAPARPEHCRSLQGHGAASEPWGAAWLGRGQNSGQGPSCAGDKSGEEEGQSASLFQGQKGKRLD